MICTENRFHVNHFEATEHVFLYLKVKFHADVPRPIYGLTIKTPDGITVYGTNSRDWSKTEQFTARHAEDITVVCFALVPELTTGHYLLSLGVVTQSDSDEIEPLDRRYDLIEVYVSNQSKCFGIADLGMKVAHVT